ncbi:MAG: isochorismatase family protein [Candidatus Uhrbacteria bacterium]
MFRIQLTDILVVNDVCETFMPGPGPRLAVMNGHEVVPVIRRIMSLFPKQQRVAVKERHPKGHIALASSYKWLEDMTVMTREVLELQVREYGPSNVLASHAKFTLEDVRRYLAIVGHFVLWPDHGIAGTPEAELHPEFQESEFAYVLVKGSHPCEHAYSAFCGDAGTPTEFEDILHMLQGQRIFGTGLAFDYCVGWLLVHAADRGFGAYCIEDATCAVDVPSGSVVKMKERFAKRGVQVIHSSHLLPM